MTTTQAIWLGMGIACWLLFLGSVFTNPDWRALGGLIAVLLTFGINGIYRLGVRHGRASSSAVPTEGDNRG